MELIKKQISLEDFKCRIPALVSCIKCENYDDNDFQKKGAWGNIAHNIKIVDKIIPFNKIIDIYNTLMNVVINSTYYEYDNYGNKWITKNEFDWRNLFDTKNTIKCKFIYSLPNSGDTGYIYGLTTKKMYEIFDKYTNFFTTLDSIGIIRRINEIIGKEIIPPMYECTKCGHRKIGYNITGCTNTNCGCEDIIIVQETYVPYLMYWVDINDTIELLEELSGNTHDCCDVIKYDKYGGDVLLTYLKSLTGVRYECDNDNNCKLYEYGKGMDDVYSEPTINIPILLTSKLKDLGQYRTYDVDTIGEGNENGSISTVENEPNNSVRVVQTSGESKLRTLRKRKRSVDDNGDELPFILSVNNSNGKTTYLPKSPYEVGYIKNIKKVGNRYYGDTIVNKSNQLTINEITEETFNTLSGDIICHSGITISEKLDEQYNNKLIADIEINKKINGFYDSLAECLKNDYDENKCLIIKGEYEYSCKYTDGSDTIEYTVSGCVYAMITSVDVEITYVLGGELEGKLSGDSLVYELIELSPFTTSTTNWNGKGIWYKETYPLRRRKDVEFIINGDEKKLSYDEIDFKSKEITYSFDGIDFPRKNYILCDNIIYATESYKEDNPTTDVIFKDEKMTTINYPLKEKYDISIDRGSVSAFEKHIQLTDIKTWDDLENYRNGMFLNR